MSPKQYVNELNSNYYLECGRSGCASGSPYKIIKTTTLGGATAILTSLSSPHQLSGSQLSYFVIKDDTLYQFDLEFDTVDYSTAPANKIFTELLSSFKFLSL